MKIILLIAVTLASSVAANVAKSAMEIPLGTYFSDTRPVVESRIVNGQQANLGQFPYQAYLIGYRDNLKTIGVLSCGGVIIASNWVVTAAHCCYENNNLNNLLGSIGISAGSEYSNIGVGGKWQKRTVLDQNTHPHPGYNPSTLMNDIALLNILVGFYITSDPYVRPVALPSAGLSMAANVGEELTVSGFGRTSTDGPASERLLWTTLEVITRTACQARYLPTLPTTCFCGEDKTAPISSTCRGDSGGPITMKINNVPTLVGIVSFNAPTCGTAPQGYTDVTQYVEWISQMQSK